LPAATIELGNRERRFGEIVGQEHQRLAGLGIGKANAPQRQLGMQLDGGFAPPELGPRKQRHTQIDGHRVQRIGSLFEFGPERLVGLLLSRLPDQDVSKIQEDSPIPFFVGVGQSAARGGLANAAAHLTRAWHTHHAFCADHTAPIQ
jgi:hypothetical protein